MDPPTFDKNFLLSRKHDAGPYISRPRTMSPNAGSVRLPGIDGANHLDRALDLVLGIVERLQREKTSFSASEKDKMVRIGKAAGMMTESKVFTSFAADDSRPLTPTSSSDPNRISGLFQKLKNASQASQVYRELTVSKTLMSAVSEFAIKASETNMDAGSVVAVLNEHLRTVFPTIVCDVFLADRTFETMWNPVTEDLVPLVSTHVLGVLKDADIPKMVDDFFCIPMYSGGQFIGVLRVKMADGALTDNIKQNLIGIASTAAVSFRNVRLMSSVKWQVEKAEAMLKMANQLSRDNLDERVLAQSIMQTAKQLTESDRCSIFLVNGPSLQAYFEDGKTVNISIDTGIAGHVAKTGEVVNIKDAYEDARFNSSVDKATGYRTKTILCMPVTYEGTIVAVAQLINKKPQQSAKGSVERAFTERDEELFHTFSTFAGVSLRNCRINANLVREKKKSEAVLDVVQLLSETDIRDVNGIVSHVMLGAKKLLNADRSSLFLFDKERDELYSKVADSTGGKEIRFKSGLGIAGTVASSGVAENIADAYEDDRFNRDVDKAFNYRTRSILCEPIMRKGDVIAVAQLVNRLEDDSGEVTTFTADDQLTFRTFAMFAGISISNSHLLEFAVKAGQEAMALNEKREAGPMKRTNSTVSALVPVSDEELERVRSAPLAESALQVTSRDYDFFEVREGRDALEVGVQVAFRVIWSTGLPEKFKCPEDTLYKFIVQCRRRYRSVPYHNFFHAVDVCQTVHTFLYEGKAAQYLTDLECFVLLVTALVHDLDHMGVNNSFHMKTDSPLGILSSASGNNSVLEVHHCNLAIEILEDKRSNVFCGLDSAEVKQAYRGMIDCVLSTDMARHGDLSTTFSEMETINKEDEQDRRLVMEMVLKAADISNVTKPFAISKKWAMCVTEEFYQQGDKEKERGVAVLPMFDRKANNELAKGQIGFISFLAEKFFAIVAKNITGLQWTVDNIESNKRMWEQVLEARRRSTISQAMSQ